MDIKGILTFLETLLSKYLFSTLLAIAASVILVLEKVPKTVIDGVGVSWTIICLFCICFLFIELFRKTFALFRRMKATSIKLKNLSKAEAVIILKFYSKEFNEFFNSTQTVAILNENDRIVLKKLVNRNILVDQTQLEMISNYNGEGVLYSLVEGADKQLNKPRHRNIVIKAATLNK